MELLVVLLIAFLVFVLLWYLIGLLPPPFTAEVKNILRIILIVAAIIFLVTQVLPI